VVYACKVIDKRKLNMEVDNKDLLLEQLRKEIEILQHLHHPNIVQFEDVIETAEKLFVIMELIQGGELFEYLLDRGPLPEDVALHVFRQVMGAITYMHDRGVVHRDLKAENLLVVDATAEYPTVKVRREGVRKGRGIGVGCLGVQRKEDYILQDVFFSSIPPSLPFHTHTF